MAFELNGRKLNEFGNSVTTIELDVGVDFYDEGAIMKEIAPLIVKSCPNVKKIHVSEKYYLYWNTSPHSYAVLYVVHRDEDPFSPDIKICTGIRELEFPVSTELIKLLRTAGVSLEILDVTDIGAKTVSYTEFLDAIQHNCTSLKTILLSNDNRVIEEVGEKRYAFFLCSLESQLTKAYVDGLLLKSFERF